MSAGPDGTTWTVPTTAATRAHVSDRREHRQFRRMVVIALPMFLVVAAFARLSRGSWRPWPSRRNGRRSIVSEAREAAETYVGFAFVGW